MPFSLPIERKHKGSFVKGWFWRERTLIPGFSFWGNMRTYHRSGFRSGGNIRMYPRSGFRSGGTSTKTTLFENPRSYPIVASKDVSWMRCHFEMLVAERRIIPRKASEKHQWRRRGSHLRAGPQLSVMRGERTWAIAI